MKYEVSNEQIEALAREHHDWSWEPDNWDDAAAEHKQEYIDMARAMVMFPAMQEILRATAEEHWDRAAILCGDLGASTAHLLRANPHRKAAQ